MNEFDESYYLRGQETGKSNYTDYSWKPDQTLGMAQHLKRYLHINDGDRVLEVGCARGYYTHALRLLGVDAYGQDISEWAITNCHPEVKPFVSNHLNGAQYDVTWSKDCFEHIHPRDMLPLMQHLCKVTKRKIFLIVPLSEKTDGRYVHPKEECDPTHVNRWTLHDWIAFLQETTNSFVVSGAYQYPGIKPGCFEVKFGYGFISLDRL